MIWSCPPDVALRTPPLQRRAAVNIFFGQALPATLPSNHPHNLDRQLPVFDCADWTPGTARFFAIGPNAVRCCVPAMAFGAAPFERRIVVDINRRQALSAARSRQFVHIVKAVSWRFGAFGTPGAAFLVSGWLYH